jgi:L-alanine-DL-glutamate epimerase-like enolase superfamily enzyme
MDRLLVRVELDVAQPSVTRIGGISGLRAVQALAAGHGVAVMPHSPCFGPGRLAPLQGLAATAEAAPIEASCAGLARPPHPALIPREGAIAVPEGPGLGLLPDPACLPA